MPVINGVEYGFAEVKVGKGLPIQGLISIDWKHMLDKELVYSLGSAVPTGVARGRYSAEGSLKIAASALTLFQAQYPLVFDSIEPLIVTYAHLGMAPTIVTLPQVHFRELSQDSIDDNTKRATITMPFLIGGVVLINGAPPMKQFV